MSKISFSHTQSPFFKSLKTKVDHYFATTGFNRAGNSLLLVKGIIQVSAAIFLYSILVFFTPPVIVSILLCVLLGFVLALIGFNIMHEGGHQTFSSRPWLNTLAAYFLNVLGGNTYYWKIKHNINHHTYTNIEGMDSDIDVKPFMRLHTEQPHHWFHRYQYVYWVVLYGISYVVWVFYHDFEKYVTGKITMDGKAEKLARKEHVIFWVTKLFYIGAYLVVPIYAVGWLWALVGFAIVTFVCGLTISVVFQLAHVVEGTDFPKPVGTSGKVAQEWAIHQLQTTSNFATRSQVVSWLLGGLNFQVEHHLFPRISHVHYPAINQLLKQTCQEHQIPYLEQSSFLEAFRSHIRYIHSLGKVAEAHPIENGIVSLQMEKVDPFPKNTRSLSESSF